MSPRGVLLGLSLVAVAAGAVAFAVWRAPQLDLAPVASRFLTDLDEGRALEALQGSLLRDRWDLIGLLESNVVRQRRLGRLVRMGSAGPEEEVPLPPGLGHGVGRRMRLHVVFERGENDVLFTFARIGPTWAVRDFEFQSMEPPERPGIEQHTRRMGMQLAEDMSMNRWANVHGRLLRADRIANSLEFWMPRMAVLVDGLGGFQRVEERGWKFADGRGTLSARLVFDSRERDVELGLVFDPTEGRVVITRLEFLP